MNQKYLVEKKEFLLEQDLFIVRRFYQPLLGSVATNLYQTLTDMSNINNSILKYSLLKSLLIFMDISKDQFIKAKTILEALGLVRTYEKLDQNIFIYTLLKPLSPRMFLKNKLLNLRLKKIIGEIELERLFFEYKICPIDKDEFIDTTTRYQDVFNVEIKEEASKTLTTKIAIPTYANVNEAIRFLTTEQFIPYLTNQRATPNQLKQISNFKSIGFSNNSLNLLINYSFEVNGKIVLKYISKIAGDFFERNILLTEDIQTELENALKNKRGIPKPDDFSKIITEGNDELLDDIFDNLYSL